MPGRSDMLLMRALPIFSLVGGFGYFIFMGANIYPFVFYPEVGEWHRRAITDGTVGPPMFWYGWLCYSALSGLFAAGLFVLLPARVALALTGRLSWINWVVPCTVVAAIAYFLRHYLR